MLTNTWKPSSARLTNRSAFWSSEAVAWYASHLVMMMLMIVIRKMLVKNL